MCPGSRNRLEPLRFWVNPLLRRIMETSGEVSKERLHASLALLPVDQEQVEYLCSRLLLAGPGELLVLRDALRPFRERLIGRLWKVLEQSDDKSQYLQAGRPWHCMTQQILGGRRSAAR